MIRRAVTLALGAALVTAGDPLIEVTLTLPESVPRACVLTSSCPAAEVTIAEPYSETLVTP